MKLWPPSQKTEKKPHEITIYRYLISKMPLVISAPLAISNKLEGDVRIIILLISIRGLSSYHSNMEPIDENQKRKEILDHRTPFRRTAQQQGLFKKRARTIEWNPEPEHKTTPKTHPQQEGQGLA